MSKFKTSKFKTTLIAGLIAAGTFAGAPAFASSYQIWNGSSWTGSGSFTVTGPTTATVAGIAIPCDVAVFTVTLTSGAAALTGANFDGSSNAACHGVKASANMSAPVAIAGSSSIKINLSNVKVTFPNPPSTCAGGVGSGTLTNTNPNSGPSNNNFTFAITSFTSGPCSNVKSTANMASNKPVRAVFP